MTEIESAFARSQELVHLMAIEEKRAFLGELVSDSCVSNTRLLSLLGQMDEDAEELIEREVTNCMHERYSLLPSSVLATKFNATEE